MLGPCVESIDVQIFPDAQTVDLEQLASISLTCSRLETISLSVTPESALSVVRALLTHDMPLLTTLDLHIYTSLEFGDEEFDREKIDGDVREALLELGKHAGTLRTFKFDGPSQDEGAFESFARGARLLQNIELYFFQTTGEYRSPLPGAGRPNHESSLVAIDDTCQQSFRKVSSRGYDNCAEVDEFVDSPEMRWPHPPNVLPACILQISNPQNPDVPPAAWGNHRQ